ncbi:MT-A70 family methyltransferase [Leisingera sp.]|uniref:MT-A70 family methyltransferase n=1 Tax=Leisingera sp. TaxID=1879318 RepID=UPI002B27301E|nr:MT-A70 family methyltransferase [Leisingera sp.]
MNLPGMEIGEGFDLIMADPPWHFATRSKKGVTAKGAGGQYRTMSLDEIKAMRVADIAARDCLLWLWATNPMLPQAFEVMAAWGFAHKTGGHWVKTTKNGKLAFGTGYILRCAGEPFLIGTIGRPRTTRNVRSVLMGRVREHSRKPEEGFREAERLITPELLGRPPHRLELFSRQERPGWSVWGDQTDKFQPPALGGLISGPSS